MKTNYKIMLLLGLFSLSAIANPPLKVDKIKRIGRLTYFQNIFDYSYYLPTAFAVDFSCLPQGQKKSHCLLKIFNNLTEDEEKLINTQGDSEVLSNLSYAIVGSIDETLNYTNSLTDLNQVKVIYNKTLQLSPAPYVMTGFSIAKEKADELIKLFNSTGFGTYNVKVEMTASDTGFYLSIMNSKLLKDKLLQLEDTKVRYWNLSETISEIANQLEIKSIGFEKPKISVFDKIKSKYFEKTGIATYRIKSSVVRNIDDNEEIFEDDTTTNPYTCTSTLNLQNNAQPVTKCNDREND